MYVGDGKELDDSYMEYGFYFSSRRLYTFYYFVYFLILSSLFIIIHVNLL